MTTKKDKILVVDDENLNLELMEAKLTPLGYKVLLAKSGEETLEIVRKNPPDLILLDIMMPEMDGFEVAKILKNSKETQLIPIVMVTALRDLESRVKALEAGADDFLSKPVEDAELHARVRTLLKVKAYNDHMKDYQQQLESEVAQRTEDLKSALAKLSLASLETINRLSTAAEYKDEDTGEHIQRVSLYAVAVAREMGLDKHSQDLLVYAAPMHDIGKIGIPDQILLKPGKLDPYEWKIMKMHTTIGGEILSGSNAEFVQVAEIIALSHHEKWDGSGYPKGLKGEDIPLFGRITAISDVFDALTSRRPYKEPFPIDKSLKIIEEGRGSHFDPRVVDAFFAVKNEIVSIREEHHAKTYDKLLDS